MARSQQVTRVLSSGIGLIVILLAAMWAIEIVDSLLLDGRLQRNGIHPRRADGIDGILWTPLLHATYGHLGSNTVPFVALGWLVAIRGVRYWALVTAATWLGGGALTWVFAGGFNHIGASGLVFGYFGALVGGAIFDRRPAVLAPALIALFMYGTLLAGVVPQEAISWEGHLFGLVSGLAIVWPLADPPPPAPPPEDDALYPWEADEPWLDSE